MKKLREKMIFSVVLSTISVFAITWGIVSVLLFTYNTRQADSMTSLINVYNGVVPHMQEYEPGSFDLDDIFGSVIFNEESAFRTRYFVVYLDDQMLAERADTEHIASVDNDDALSMAETAVAAGEPVGYIGRYRYRITQNSSGQNAVIFIDCNENFISLQTTSVILATIFTIIAILVALIFSLISKRVMKPFEENAKRQKQFITDAGHELKTPLAIISANAEVLEYKNGSSEWLDNIIGQVRNMSGLIERLLTLSRMDEFSEEFVSEPVDFSAVVTDLLGSFSEVFQRRNITVQAEIAPNVIVNANPKQLQMLVSILVENASKYTAESGTVRASLYGSGKTAVFRLYNTADLPEDIQIERLFDRFYRPDASRTSSTGGQGIGLSIARQIMLMHGGCIYGNREDKGICFTAEFPSGSKGKARK